VYARDALEIRQQTPNLLAIAKKFLKKRHAPVFHSGRKFVRGA
jgi:hypothetical protein